MKMNSKDRYIDPICGMDGKNSGITISWNGNTYYFCSNHCKEKFVKDNKIQIEQDYCHTKSNKKSFYKNKLFYILAVYFLVFISGKYIEFVLPLSKSLLMYMRTIAAPILIGLSLGGVIDWLVPREYISKILAQKKKRTILYAVITGFFMSACSHGILALAIQLYKKGASPPAVVAFLLASPWANLPLTILMFGFFGFKALLIVLSAIVIAIISGLIFNLLEQKDLIEHNPYTVSVDKEFSVITDIRIRLKKAKLSISNVLKGIKAIISGAISLGNMVLWWILLGMLLASIAAAYIPPNFMHQYMGASIIGLLVTLFVATIMEICSEGTAPLAFEIYRQTGAFGNSFVFLMAGVVTDYTEIGLLWSNIGKRTAVLLPIITVPQVIFLGYLFNILF
ncbi:permease [Candidatus Margulisiibacteriota bacterium]